MGVTFLGSLASDASQRVVVKIPLSADGSIVERFKNEVRILASLNHPNIVRFIGSGEAEITVGAQQRKLPWLAMEYLSGQSLRALLTQKKQATWEEVHPLLKHILQALDYLHSQNLCHRDIKPDNLIHDPQTDSWKLVDFGIAKELVDNLRLTLTIVETDPGAWDYMSPEQLSGKSVDIRSDIYSLGKTAWEALIGDVPRAGTAYPCALLGADKVPADVDKLIANMTAHQEERRYQTPAEALEALKQGAGEIEEKDKWRQKRKRAFRFIKVSAAVLAIIAAAWFIGDEYATQKAKAIVSATPQSETRATLTRRQLETFRNTHWFWGRKFADSQYLKMEPIAKDEFQKMEASFQTIVTEANGTSHDDEYKFNRCLTFCKLYEDRANAFKNPINGVNSHGSRKR